MENIQILNALKWLLIGFFGALIITEFYYSFAIHLNLGFLLSRICVLLALICVIYIKNKTTWFLGLILSIYALYDIIIVGYSEFNPALMDFTSPLLVIFKNAGNFIRLVINIFPVIFFFLMILSFSTRLVRKWYGFELSNNKGKKNYL